MIGPSHREVESGQVMKRRRKTRRPLLRSWLHSWPPIHTWGRRKWSKMLGRKFENDPKTFILSQSMKGNWVDNKKYISYNLLQSLLRKWRVTFKKLTFIALITLAIKHPCPNWSLDVYNLSCLKHLLKRHVKLALYSSRKAISTLV